MSGHDLSETPPQTDGPPETWEDFAADANVKGFLGPKREILDSTYRTLLEKQRKGTITYPEQTILNLVGDGRIKVLED